MANKENLNGENKDAMLAEAQSWWGGSAYLEVVLELEGLLALGALELAQHCALVVGDHVSLEPVDVGEGLVTHLARLEHTREK